MILISERLEHNGTFYYRDHRADGTIVWKHAWEDPIISNEIDILEKEYQLMRGNDNYFKKMPVAEFAKIRNKTTAWVYNVYLKLNPEKSEKIGGFQFVLVDPSEVPAPPVLSQEAVSNYEPVVKARKKIQKSFSDFSNVVNKAPKLKEDIAEDDIKYQTGRDGSKFRRSFP